MYTLKDDAGNIRCLQQFPQVGIANRLAHQLGQMEQTFGMTPSARTRVHVLPEDNEGLPTLVRYSEVGGRAGSLGAEVLRRIDRVLSSGSTRISLPTRSAFHARISQTRAATNRTATMPAVTGQPEAKAKTAAGPSTTATVSASTRSQTGTFGALNFQGT